MLQKPVEQEYTSIIDRYRADQQLMEVIQCAERHRFRAISGERAPLVRLVLDMALEDESCREIAIIGSTLNGLFRQGVWFEEFVRATVSKGEASKVDVHSLGLCNSS